MVDTKNSKGKYKAKCNRFLVAGAVAVGLGSVALIGCTKAFDVEHSAGIQAGDFGGSSLVEVDTKSNGYDEASLDLEDLHEDDSDAHDHTSFLQTSWYMQVRRWWSWFSNGVRDAW